MIDTDTIGLACLILAVAVVGIAAWRQRRGVSP